VDALLVVVDLDAKASARERMVGIAAHRNGLAILDGREHRAGVRAIMRTRAYDGGAGHGVLRVLLRSMPNIAAFRPAWLLRTCGILFLTCFQAVDAHPRRWHDVCLIKVIP